TVPGLPWLLPRHRETFSRVRITKRVPRRVSFLSLKAYDNLWKQWGLKAKPGDYNKAVMERYGLHRAPFENGGRPMGLIEAKGLLGKGLVNNCLLCRGISRSADRIAPRPAQPAEHQPGTGTWAAAVSVSGQQRFSGHGDSTSTIKTL